MVSTTPVHYPTDTVGDLRIGTSGWHYPTGRGTWNGVFYPPTRGRRKDFDELEYYSRHFNTVEVNSTFYGQPRAEVTRGWAERTPDDFEFAVKLFQKFTHPRMFAQRVAHQLKGTDTPPDAIAALSHPLAADIDEFRRGIEPLADRGKLGVLLAQFPASFKRGDAESAYLAGLLKAFGAYTVAVELRHRSWSDALPDTLALLKTFNAAWVQIDEPKFRSSIHQNLLPNIAGAYYLRLHGRNAAQWWHHAKSEDRYNYLYSADELREFSTALGASQDIVKKAYLYTNNHFSAQSVANAAMIKHQVGLRVEGEYSEEFLKRFPELAGVVTPEKGQATQPQPARRRTLFEG
jgi:uncharacterized protein YecE (DUF72 family)